MREVLIKAILTLVIVAGAMLVGSYFQADEHEGQPEHCTNAKNAPKAHKCECKKTEDACDIEDKACKVYCRKNKCYCAHPGCTT